MLEHIRKHFQSWPQFAFAMIFTYSVLMMWVVFDSNMLCNASSPTPTPMSNENFTRPPKSQGNTQDPDFVDKVKVYYQPYHHPWVYHNMTGLPQTIPAKTHQTASLIFLPGHGNSARRWLPDMEKVRTDYMKVTIPQANEMNITWYSGAEIPTWFDFSGDEFPCVQNSTEGMKKAMAYIHHLIQDEIDIGVDPSRIFVSGFSQGAFLAIHAAMTFPKKLGGIIAIAPWHPHEEFLHETIQPCNKNIPILQLHVEGGEPFISDNSCYKTEKFLKKYASHYTEFKMFEGDHGRVPTVEEEFIEMKKFLKEHAKPIKA